MKDKPLNFIYPSFLITIDDTFSLDQMKELDNYTINNFQIPVELMMENAGYHLARLVTKKNEDKHKKTLIGVGNGNNGGGGNSAPGNPAGYPVGDTVVPAILPVTGSGGILPLLWIILSGLLIVFTSWLVTGKDVFYKTKEPANTTGDEN